MIGVNIFRTWWSKPMERGQFLLLLLIGLLTVTSWILTIQQARTMDMPMGVVISGAVDRAESSGAAGGMDTMPGMVMDTPASDDLGEMAATGMSSMGWTLGGFFAFLFAWSVMMAAMMFPAAAPMILFFQKVASKRKGQGRTFVPTWIFAAGYFLIWIGVGVATWVLIRLTSDLTGRFSDASREVWAPFSLGAVLIVAGLYQFTPIKSACLRQCQSPVSFVMTHWQEGRGGALHMGLVHGMYCLGCCWMLFAVLVAAGVMSLAWMLALTLVVFAEKALPFGTRAVQITGAAFIVLGILIATGATDLPWSA
jgi:predicted metal-binding membrane protein